MQKHTQNSPNQTRLVTFKYPYMVCPSAALLADAYRKATCRNRYASHDFQLEGSQQKT
eukprot:c43293_g1_i1 orf=3-173(-)